MFDSINILNRLGKLAMDTKSSHFLSSLWKATPFHILAQPGKQQLQVAEEHLQRTINIFSSIESKFKVSSQKLHNHRFHIPAFQNLQLELKSSQHRLENYLQHQAAIFNSLIQQLAEVRYLFEQSQINAMKEFCENVTNFSQNQNHETVSLTQIEKIIDEQLELSRQEKLKVCQQKKRGKFQTWYAKFSIRCEDFFMSAYCYELKSNDKTFGLKTENQLSHCIFKAEDAILGTAKTIDEQESNDIVSQIYRQYELQMRCE